MVGDLGEEVDELETRVGDRVLWEVYSDYGVQFEYPPEMLFMDILSSEDFGVVTGMFGYDPDAMTVVEAFNLG